MGATSWALSLHVSQTRGLRPTLGDRKACTSQFPGQLSMEGLREEPVTRAGPRPQAPAGVGTAQQQGERVRGRSADTMASCEARGRGSLF